MSKTLQNKKKTKSLRLVRDRGRPVPDYCVNRESGSAFTIGIFYKKDHHICFWNIWSLFSDTRVADPVT